MAPGFSPLGTFGKTLPDDLLWSLSTTCGSLAVADGRHQGLALPAPPGIQMSPHVGSHRCFQKRLVARADGQVLRAGPHCMCTGLGWLYNTFLSAFQRMTGTQQADAF